MRTSTKLASSVAAALLLASAASWGHARLNTPPSRDKGLAGADSHKNGPCGGVVKGKPVMKYAAGATTMNIQWEETIDHTGCFVLDVSTTGNDNDFKVLKVVKDPTNAGVSQATPRAVMTNIALDGGITCPNCTFRLRQIMGANPDTCNGATVGTGGTYFSCADIMIGDFDAGTTVPVADAAVVPETDAASDSDAGTTTPGTDGGKAGTDGGGNGIEDEDPAFPGNSGSGCSTSPGPVSGLAGLGALSAVAALAFARARKKSKKS